MLTLAYVPEKLKALLEGLFFVITCFRNRTIRRASQ